MFDERSKWYCAWMVSFSLLLAACGAGAAGITQGDGAAPEQTEIRVPSAAAIRQPTAVSNATATWEGLAREDCPVSEAAWVKPPEDAAVPDEPAYGYYYVNEDGSMWASAWWTGAEGYDLRAGEEGNKVGWFRPEGATLEITGQRLDAKAPVLDAHVPCCYPTRFQATGLIFPTEGCWEVMARAEDSLISFVVWVAP